MKDYFKAILQPTTTALEELLSVDSTEINTPYSDTPKNAPRTLLSFAARLGKVDMMTVLLGRGAFVDVLDSEGKTALFYAVIADKPEAVELLLESGADPLLKDHAGQRSIQYAKPASTSLAYCVSRICKIATSDPDPTRRKRASKITSAVFKSTMGALDEKIAASSEHFSTVEGAFQTLTGAASEPGRFFSAPRQELQVLAGMAQLLRSYSEVLIQYMSIVDLPLSAPEDRDLSCLIQEGDALLHRLNSESKHVDSSYPVPLHSEQMVSIIRPVSDMAILSYFLMSLRSTRDLRSAFTATQSKFLTEVGALSADSTVHAFFTKKGVYPSAGARYSVA